jgi:hypothetical protein
MRHRPVLVIILIVQLIGIACLALWERAPSVLAMPMWGTALILLFPGNFLGGWLVESLLWGHLSLIGMGLLSAVLAVIINALLWFLVAKTVQIIYAYLFVHSGSRRAKPATQSRRLRL